MDYSPLVSCICPTFGRAPEYLHLLEETIESFLRQTYPNKELVVLNDCPGQELVCDAPGVRVVNAPERFPSLGDKYNAAINLAQGELIAPWEDDDIYLPWRLALTVERLGTADYLNSRRYWFLDGSGLHFDHPMGVGHNGSIFRRSAFAAVGGYLSVSGPQDAHMDQALSSKVVTVSGALPGQEALAIEDWYYIYRWGVQPWHLSGAPKTEDFYRAVGELPHAQGRFHLNPQWKIDYVAETRRLLDVYAASRALAESKRSQMADLSGLTMLEAKYGSTYGELDVTEKVQAMVLGGRPRFVVSNALFTDPSPNARKTLRITFEQSGESRPNLLEIGEGETADLSSLDLKRIGAAREVLEPPKDAASRLQAEYEARRSEWSDIVDHLPTLYETVIRYPGARVLELGVRTGTSTSAFLAAVAAVGGHLWSVDIFPPQVPSWWADTEYWTLTVGDDLAESVINAAPVDVDVLFIDTSHVYEQTLAELRTYVPRVRAGGVVMCHDTEVAGPAGVGASTPFPVARALDEFCKETGLAWVNRSGSHGLGIIQLSAAGKSVPADRV